MGGDAVEQHVPTSGTASLAHVAPLVRWLLLGFFFLTLHSVAFRSCTAVTKIAPDARAEYAVDVLAPRALWLAGYGLTLALLRHRRVAGAVVGVGLLGADAIQAGLALTRQSWMSVSAELVLLIVFLVLCSAGALVLAWQGIRWATKPDRGKEGSGPLPSDVG